MSSPTTIVSCPGKVLLSGGYVVLHRSYSGVVIGTASRFYTIIQCADHQPNPQLIQLSIRSPQFLQAEWSYLVDFTNPDHPSISSDPSASRNKFVEFAVRESLKLSFALETANPSAQAPLKTDAKPYQATIHILGDNDFYSQPRRDDAANEPFNRLNTSLKDVHKTGLGSSAAMVTSLCAAIFLHFTPSLKPHSSRAKALVHNLSQYVHSLAQGKVGSGFDVSAATWGTHLYRRFSPGCLGNLLDSDVDQEHITPAQLRETLDPSRNPAWTDPSTRPTIEQFSIPKYTTLMLADVDAGSHTPSMVAQVLKWKAEETEAATQIWTELSSKNNQLTLAFKKLEALSTANDAEYLAHVVKMSNDPNFHTQSDPSPVVESDDVTTVFIKISSLTKSIRRLMKTMGEQSGVPIEPDSQTGLLDGCERQMGVIGSGVPGAGGYDAIWALVLTPPGPSPTLALAGFFNAWPHSSVRVLSSHAWVVGGPCLVDRDLDDGIRVFDGLEQVEALRSQTWLFS